MTNKKKDYQEPALYYVVLRNPKILSGSKPAEGGDDPDPGARRHDFGD